MDKITKGYVNRFDMIKFTQILPSGRRIHETYYREPAKEMWRIQYTTDSAYHICPYDGTFRECGDCNAVLDSVEDTEIVEKCLEKMMRVSSEVLARRCTLCEKGKNCKVDYWSNF